MIISGGLRSHLLAESLLAIDFTGERLSYLQRGLTQVDSEEGVVS